MKYSAEILKPEEWGLIEPIMLSEFGNGMPTNPEQSFFRVVRDKERIAGFVHVEQVFHLNCIWISPEYRQDSPVFLLMDGLDNVPKGHATIAYLRDDEEISSEMRRAQSVIGRMFVNKYGARYLGKQHVYRKDY